MSKTYYISVGEKDGYFRHGGPYDRGGADYYYWRECVPHYYRGATFVTERVSIGDMTKGQRDAYYAGWKDAKADNNRKEWR
jgi:hypothetical protein